MSDAAVEIKARLNADDAKNAANDLGKELLGSITPTIDVANLAAKGLAILGDAIRSVADYAKEGVIAASEAEEAELRLTRALELRGKATGGVLDALKQFNASIQQSTTISDDELVRIQTKLTALGVLPERLQEATLATIGLSEATGKGLANAATDVSKVLEGNLNTLKRAGIEANTTEEAMRQLAGMFDLAKQKTQTLEGQFSLLSTNMGELQEAFGGSITKSREAVGLLSDMNSVLVELTDEMGKRQPGITAFFDAIFGGVRSVLGFVREHKAEIADFLAFVGKSATALAGPAGLAFQAVSDTGTLIGLGSSSSPGGFSGDGGQSLGIGETTLQSEPNQAAIEAQDRAAKATQDREQKRRQDATRNAIAAKKAAAAEEAEVDRELYTYHARLRSEAERDEKTAEDRARKRTIAGLEYGEIIANYKRDRTQARIDEKAAQDARAEENDNKHLEKQRAFWGQLGVVVQGGVANYIANIVQAAAAGESFDAGKLLGQMLVQMGSTAIGMGALAAAGGVVGTIVPFLAPFTGGAAAIPAGLGLIAAGSAAIGVGTLLGGGGAAHASARGGGFSGGGGGGGGRALPLSVPDGFSAGRGSGGGPVTYVTNVQFGSGVVHGTPRQIARALEESLTQGRSLRIGGR